MPFIDWLIVGLCGIVALAITLWVFWVVTEPTASEVGHDLEYKK